MESTWSEDINAAIVDYLKEIHEQDSFVSWVQEHGAACDQVMQGIVRRHSTETWCMTREEVACWRAMPETIRRGLLDYLDIIRDSRLYCSSPMTSAALHARALVRISFCERLVTELRRARDSGDAAILHRFVYQDVDGAVWAAASTHEQERAKMCWRGLAAITVPEDQYVLYMDVNSPKHWKDRTREWTQEYLQQAR